MKLDRNKYMCKNLIVKIDSLSPLKTLSRGYSVVENNDGKVVKSISQVNKNDKLQVTLTDGKINVIVD